MNHKILNSKDIKKLHKQLAEQYGFAGKLDLVFMLQEKKEKLYVFTKDLAKIDIANLKVDAMGLYFGAWFNGKFRLTIEGTQLIGNDCTKNVVELTKEEMQQWLQGESLEREANAVGEFVIVKCGNDFLGCGKVVERKILNYIPKTRYVHAVYDEN